MTHRLVTAVMVLGLSACDGCRGSADDAQTSIAPAWITIAPGRFSMGSANTEMCREVDEKRIEVTLTQRFAMSAHEVTQRAFADVTGYNPSNRRGCDSCPVDSVTHHEAANYCAAISKKEGLPVCYQCSGARAELRCEANGEPSTTCAGYRLPTEAEWEYAARAGSKTAVPGGRLTSCMGDDDAADQIGWYKVSSGGQSHPVGTKKSNRWGIYDMAGNVYEWTADWYAPALSGGSDPLGPTTGTERVLKGGSWYHNAEHLRSANRHAFRPDKRLSYVGFRCVRSINSETPAGS